MFGEIHLWSNTALCSYKTQSTVLIEKATELMNLLSTISRQTRRSAWQSTSRSNIQTSRSHVFLSCCWTTCSRSSGTTLKHGPSSSNLQFHRRLQVSLNTTVPWQCMQSYRQHDNGISILSVCMSQARTVLKQLNIPTNFIQCLIIPSF